MKVGSNTHSHQGVGNFIWARRLPVLAGVGEDRLAYIDPPKKAPGLRGTE